jgi:Zn finger protein HypA/HybF involved in hydrogenase expression
MNMENKICEYGCGQNARYILKNGKYCCSKNSNQCLELRKKNSLGLKAAHKEGRRHYTYNIRSNWNKNITLLNYDEVFIEHSNKKTSVVKSIILRDKLKPYRCEKCQNYGQWENEELILELDHINGDGTDNRLENLRFLCPNCHSQTPTFRGRNLTYNKKVTDEDMINSILSSYTISEALRKCGLVEKGGNFKRVKKIIAKYKIELKQKECCKKNRCPRCNTEIEDGSKMCKECAELNQRKVERPPYEQLLKEIKETSYCAVGRKYGVSDNAIRKWVRNYEKHIK